MPLITDRPCSPRSILSQSRLYHQQSVNCSASASQRSNFKPRPASFAALGSVSWPLPSALGEQCPLPVETNDAASPATPMAELQCSYPDQTTLASNTLPRSSISSSSISGLSCDMSSTMVDDATSSDTDPDIADDTDGTVVKVERDTESTPVSPLASFPSAFETSNSPTASTSTEGASQATPATVVPEKRGRGRPRKNAVPIPTSPRSKTKTFVRSKTGCLTCRRRKKKCDERKPECLNCEKNGVVCKGYAVKKEWQPGVSKQKKDLARRLSSVQAAPHSVLVGIEGDLDRVFFDHYCHRLSTILTVKGDEPNNNPFLSLVIPLALDDAVVMHSLLGLAGAHLIRFDRREDYVECKEKHRAEALTLLREGVTKAVTSNADVSEGIVACMILQYQLQVIDGSPNGEYRTHFSAAREYVKFRHHQPVGRFAHEFFEYADMSISMTSLLRYVDQPVADCSIEPSSPHPPRFAIPGVVNNFDGVMLNELSGLFALITKITALRDRVRSRKQKGDYPCIEYTTIIEGAQLDKRLDTWDSFQEEDSINSVTAELYRQAAAIYLHRTMRASRPEEGLSLRVRRGTDLLETFYQNGGTMNCVLLLPTFILGCAAFQTEEREKIRDVFNRLASTNDFGNVDPSMRIVQRVWEMMDNGDEGSWDWETIREEMHYDFPIA